MARLEGKNIADYYHSQGQNSLWAVHSLPAWYQVRKEQREICLLVGEAAVDRHGMLNEHIETTDPLFPSNYFKQPPFSSNLPHC